MIRLWLSKNSAASLREQLATQLMFGVVSEELKAGERLPSVRELARRYKVHSNTVSAAYGDLVGRGWLEFKKGSGVYVRALQKSSADGESLDRLIDDLYAAAQAKGFSPDDVRSRISARLDAGPVRRLYVAEPEPELREIVVAELRERLPIKVEEWPDHKEDRRPVRGKSVAVAMLASRAHLHALLPPGVGHVLLRLKSVPEYLQGQKRPEPDALIGVASSSPEVLGRVRTILAAAGLDPDGLEFRDAREDGWRDGLKSCQFVITDIVTAPKIPAPCEKRVFRVLSEASVDELKRVLGL